MRTRWICLGLLLALQVKGIILMGTGDAERNTTAPAGTLAGSGWELQGEWGMFQGTPIGPRHFVTAKHIGGAMGASFVFRGVSYPTVASILDAESDLAIWEVRGTFPEFAQLYDGAEETGRALMVYGRGAGRGAAVNVGATLKGWQWGGWDRRLRWGTNRVTALFRDLDQTGAEAPRYLTAAFDAGAGADEAQLAVGDSGGGVFIQQGGAWRLAGINYSVDGPFNLTDTGDGFNAALFDQGGLYIGDGVTWNFVPDRFMDQPSALYATRIKPRLAWIQSVLAMPTTPALLAATTVDGPFEANGAGTIDAATRTVRIPIGEATTFFELESSVARTISNVRIEAGVLVFAYSN